MDVGVELNEKIKSLYTHAKNTWEVISSHFNIPPRTMPRLAPIVEPNEYWSLVRNEIYKRSGKRNREKVNLYLSTLREAIMEILEKEKGLYATSPARFMTEFWDLLDKELKERLDDEVISYMDRLLDRYHRLKDLIFPFALITPSPTSEEPRIRFHPILSHSFRGKYPSLKGVFLRGWADYLELPHLVHLDFDDLPDLLEDERSLGILLHPKAPELLERIKSVTRPIDSIRAIASLSSPTTLIERVNKLPRTVFHPYVLRELQKLDDKTVSTILEQLGKLKDYLEPADLETTIQVVRALRVDPSLAPYLAHRNLAPNADLILEMRRRDPALLQTLMGLMRHLDHHDAGSLRTLLRLALKKKNPSILRALVPHPDLKKHFEVLASAVDHLDSQSLRQLLKYKERWKYLNPKDVEALLQHPLGLRVLLSDLSARRKQELLGRLDKISASDVELEELSQRYNVPYSSLRLVRRYLGNKTEAFLERHRDLVASLPRRSLIPLLIYFKREDRPLSPSEINAIVKLSSIFQTNPIHLVEAVRSLDKELLNYLISVPDHVLRSFRVASLSDAENLSKELKDFLRTRMETSRRVKVRRPSLVEKMLRMLENGVEAYDPGSNMLRLSKALRRTLGVKSREIDRNEFERRLLKYLMIDHSLSRRRAREIVTRLDLDGILAGKTEQPSVWLSRERIYHPVQELREDDVFLLLSILSSIHTALSDNNVKFEGLSKDKRYIVFRILKESHHSKVLKDKDFLGYVRTLSGQKPLIRENKVFLPVEFIKALSSHSTLSSHELVDNMVDFILSRFSKNRRSSRPSRGKQRHPPK